MSLNESANLIKLLLIEDNPGDARLVQEMLKGINMVDFMFTHVDRLAKGLDYVKHNEVDLILLDMGLPDSQGLDTLLTTQAQTPHIPIVLLTGFDDETFAVNAVREGAQDYLVKDKLDSELMARSIRYAIERKRSEGEMIQRNRELNLLNRVIALSTANFSIDSNLRVACLELAKTFDLSYVTASLLNEEKTELTVTAEYLSGDLPSQLGQTFALTDLPKYEYLFETKKPLVVNTPEELAGTLHSKLRVRTLCTYLVVPIIIKDEIEGIIQLSSLQARAFTTDEVNLTWRVADQVAIVLTRIRLHEERQMLEQLYHQSQKMEALGRLTGGVAHDFNNMLTVINGFTELMYDQVSPTDPIKETLDTVLRSGQRAANLVRQLLAFSRKQIVEPQILNVNDIIIELDKMFQHVIGANIGFKMDLSPNLWSIKADPTQIEQVIMNLVLNSRDAMPNGGQLTIETANTYLNGQHANSYFKPKPGEYVVIEVSDTGCGIDKEILEHIFEPFFTTKEMGQGSGLGLASVYGIVKQSGGDILCTSIAGQGTTFKLCFPKVEQSSVVTSKFDLDQGMPTGTENIFLVEDDVEIRKLIRGVLHKQGYNLLEAQNGSEALALFQSCTMPIHMLLTDMAMPGMNGKMVAEKLRQNQPDLKVLFMSGYMDNIFLDTDTAEANNSFLQKPFNATILARKVRELLDR